MKKLYMTLGLPASSKTTTVKEMQEKDPQLVRVNKDDLRNLLHAGRWSRHNEKQILRIRNQIIRDTLEKGQSVVVDDTNFGRHEKTLREMAKQYKAEFKLLDFTDVPVETCIERDLLRSNSVGSKVIMRMYNQFIAKKEDEPQLNPMVFDEKLSYCIGVDLDGTISHMTDRSPYDGKSCGSDLVNGSIYWLLDMVRTYTNDGYDTPKVIIFSGRNGDSEPETIKWLEDNHIPYDELHMRKVGDQRKDLVIKEEMFDEYIRDKYNVLFWVDDRRQVVDHFRSMGLTVLQCAPGKF